MQSSNPVEARNSGFPKIVATEEELASLRQHLHDVLEGSAFRSSHRSGQFLRYIIEQAVAGNFDSLKERVIGIELFGRPASYDTGEDAIVRVTASDVRRRLFQHYGTYGADSVFRISLPQGSYIPEITRNSTGQKDSHDRPTPDRTDLEERPEHLQAQPPHHLQEHSASASTEAHAAAGTMGSSRMWPAIGLILTVVNAAVATVMVWSYISHSTSSPHSVAPWSALFASSRPVHIVTSDPNIAVVQELCGGSISVSDYANHNYIPSNVALMPEVTRMCRFVLSGDNPATVDPGIVAIIATLAQQASAKVEVRSARKLELTDLKTDDNYVLLGSSRSDPWSALFNDQLDFRFVFDRQSNQEIIRNARPGANELPQYTPTAMGGGTGKSFAIVALVQNLDQNGQVLLLAGANAEGTEAAGNFAADLPRMSATMRKCAVTRSGPGSHFELLLQLDTMAGSANNISLLACHLLQGGSVR